MFDILTVPANINFSYAILLCLYVLKQDVGGQDKIRPLWRHYFVGTQALIFVIDSCDHERFEEARIELHKIINDREMRLVTLSSFLMWLESFFCLSTVENCEFVYAGM